MREIRIEPSLPADEPPRRHFEAAPVTLPAYELGTMKATRRAYGEALASLGDARDDVVAMDGEVSNSTFSGLFADAAPGAASSRCSSPSSR
jgi:transketolase